MIVGTAGHIDHGKTTLVRALTGVDTDRLPEEKARGISIELGYAFMPVADREGAAAEATADDSGADTRIGFVDVPGHERLVHTMIAGATGIDFGLLLVAADDGVMPQTREHLAVLSLLGLQRGAVVITKADRADAARLAQVRADVAALLAGTALASMPLLSVSAHTGDGIAALRDLLRGAALDASTAARASQTAGAAFRLAIDRAFTLDGIGTVVTGSIHAGSIGIGDELALAPSAGNAAAVRARVRSLHAQNRAVARAHAGQRCALALAGIAKDQIARGQWLVAPPVALQTTRLDATLRLWPGEARPLRSGTPLHLHLGAADVLASVAVLQADGADAQAIAPGQTALVQLVLQQPIAAWRGDRVIVRDAAASRTLAGGTVLDPFAPARYRRTPARLAELAAWGRDGARARLQALVQAASHGVALRRWHQAEGLVMPAEGLSAHAKAVSATAEGSSAPADGLSAQAAVALPPQALTASDAVHGDWALGHAHAQAVADAAIQALRSFHQRDPELLGPDQARLRRSAAPRLPDALWKALLAQLQRQKQVAIRGAFVHLQEHGLQLSATDERLAQALAPLLGGGGFEGHWARDLARDARISEPLLRSTLARLAQRGDLHQVVKDLFYAPATMTRLAAIVRATAAASADAAVTAAQFRDATGLGRKRAIQVLEYFDRIGLLRRVGDAHRLRLDSTLFIDSVAGNAA